MTRLQIGSTTLLGVIGFVALWASSGVSAPVPKEGNTPFIQWQVKEDDDRNDINSAAVIGDRVLVGTDRGELRAYQSKDGKLLWKFEHGKRIYYRPCGDSERIYFTSDTGILAVTATDGKLAWAVDIDFGAGPSTCLGEKGIVVVGGNNGTLYTLNAKTGQILWKADFVADKPADPPGFEGQRARGRNEPARPSCLTTNGERVFLNVFDQSRVVAYSAASGTRLWSYQTQGWTSNSEVVFTADRVFFGSQDQHVYCLDKTSGQLVWKFKTKGRVESGGLVDKSVVYIPSCDGVLYCLNQSDGKEVWRYETEIDTVKNRRSAIYSTPVLRGSRLHFATGEGQFYSVAETGQLVWKLRPSPHTELY